QAAGLSKVASASNRWRTWLSTSSAAPPAREIVRSCARVRAGTHGQLPGARLKSHRQRPPADYSAQRAGPGDRAWRRARRAKGPADNKLCATKAERISRRLSDLSKNGACSYAFFRALIAASERAEICFRISREVASGRSSVSFRSPAADKNNL